MYKKFTLYILYIPPPPTTIENVSIFMLFAVAIFLSENLDIPQMHIIIYNFFQCFTLSVSICLELLNN